MKMYKSSLKIRDSVIPTNACLVTNKHHCGKSTCKCITQGALHQSTALKYRVNGKQKIKYVRQKDVDSVRRELYQRKGLEIIDRADKYTLTIAKMFPNFSGADIHIKTYEVFGQRNYLRQPHPAN